MTGGRLDRDGPTTQDQIVAAARRLFAERGYAGASIRAIADASGVQSATLYAHFPSKAALFGVIVAGPAGRARSVVLTDAADSADAADSGAGDRLATTVEAVYRSLVERSDDARLLTVELDHLPAREAAKHRADLAAAWNAVADLLAPDRQRAAVSDTAGVVAAIRAVGIGLLMPADEASEMAVDDVIAANVNMALRLARPGASV